MARRDGDEPFSFEGGSSGDKGGSGDSGGTDSGTVEGSVNPADATGQSGGTAGGIGDDNSGKPGRKRRSDIGKRRAKRGSQGSSGIPVDGLSAILLSTHALLAGITQAPEFAIAPEEAENLAKGIAAVAAYYDTTISGKALAWANLAQVVGITYGTRLFAISARRAQERKATRQANPTPPRAAPSNTNGKAPEKPADEPGIQMMPSDLNRVEPFN